MLGRIVEIADDKRHLHVLRGFLVVEEHGSSRQELGRVPLDDICAVIAHVNGITYTNNLLVALAERGIPFVLCAANHNPVGMLYPIDGHHVQSKRIEAQIDASRPTHKRLWAAVVKSKLEQQAAVLEVLSRPSEPLFALSRKVKSGDPDNLEGQGARRYWGLLFGPTFKRNQLAEAGVNTLLNYGYTILRSAMARAIIAAGLHPSIGLHHCNDLNPMRLVDDLMEPFRPIVDVRVWQLLQLGDAEITPETKRILAKTLYVDMQTDVGATPVLVCMQKLATSLAQVYLKEKETLSLPLPVLPFDVVLDCG